MNKGKRLRALLRDSSNFSSREIYVVERNDTPERWWKRLDAYQVLHFSLVAVSGRFGGRAVTKMKKTISSRFSTDWGGLYQLIDKGTVTVSQLRELLPTPNWKDLEEVAWGDPCWDVV